MEEKEYNEPIDLDELIGAIQRLKNDTAPGPDQIFSELLMKADESLYNVLSYVFNKSWEEGKLPKPWKLANVKFIRKMGKSTYNNPSSYRPISLTSILGKVMERVVTSRLEGYIETNSILDPEQEGFRHYRSTENALLSLTQNIFNAFNNNEFILAVFIDLEKAYDSVWREGLLTKLYDNGVKGNIWNWINNFLKERQARNGPIKKMNLQLEGKLLKYNCNPKILGVTLDEKLSFLKHIENVEQKAHKAISLLRMIKGVAKVSTKILLQIYQSIVLSTLEYASSVWQTCETNITDKLNKIQRKGLAICLNVTPTSSVETLEVVSGILPIHLRREEIATRTLAKINSYDISIPIKQILDDWKTIDIPEKYVSPVGKMILQAEDMKIIGKTLEIPNQDQQTKKMLENSLIMEKLSHLPANSCIAFTDGSCLGSPGPVGAGAVIFPSNNQPQIEISKAVSKKGSILLGELIAIKLVVDHFLISENTDKTQTQLHFFSDSQTSIGILTLNWKSENYIKVIREIKKNMKVLKMNGIPLNFEWTPGHADIQGNDIADSLAKKGAKEAEKIEEPSEVTRQDIKRAARESVLRKWQNQWESSQRGRNYYNYHQNVCQKIPKDLPSKWSFSITTSLRTGYCDLNDYKSKIIPSSDKNCSCGEPETVEHYLLHCSNYEEARERMRTSIYFITGNIHMDLDTLLGIDEEDINRDNRNEILCHLENYLLESGRFKNTIQQKTL
ncbi:Hypothetical predicted protein [Mytilus galloprovincialis]|uniref:Uncharacterized protein n=1 Tax=Mytilus galloprovincialis TaxID=29158 RepID=A0A8B6DTT0_MYTGA|nr:Hypothetical predicted protein [Mytilus galloprovincialis]